MADKKYILTKEVAQKKLRRMALQVVEQNYEEPELVLIGIRDNGIVLARKTSDYLDGLYKGNLVVVELTIDKANPKDITVLPVTDFNGKAIVLIDDVSNSGSTMLYSLKPLLENHPKKIQTLALVE